MMGHMAMPERGVVAPLRPKVIIPPAGLTASFKAEAREMEIKVRVHPESTSAQTRTPEHKTGTMTDGWLALLQKCVSLYQLMQMRVAARN
jgi:hypothetical protein